MYIISGWNFQQFNHILKAIKSNEKAFKRKTWLVNKRGDFQLFQSVFPAPLSVWRLSRQLRCILHASTWRSSRHKQIRMLYNFQLAANNKMVTRGVESGGNERQ